MAEYRSERLSISKCDRLFIIIIIIIVVVVECNIFKGSTCCESV